MIIRKPLITLQERMCEPRQFIQLLAGTHQVGKTTLVKQFVLTYTRKIASKCDFSCISQKKSVSLQPKECLSLKSKLLMSKTIQIRNSTTDFLVFTKQNAEDTIQVRVHDENVWLSQKAMAHLFDCSVDNIALHLKNIFASGELDENATSEESSVVQQEGSRQVTRQQRFYNLDAIISVGYRVNSIRATQFRQWATNVLKTFAVQGYVLDKQRLENGQIFDEAYFDHLIDEIREIRASERKFYQKITDIYATAVDYNRDALITKQFFATVQNKLHFAIHGNTAAEVIMQRANAEKEHMGLTSWKNAPSGKIVRADVSVAKNYLSLVELDDLNQIVTMYLDYAERQAKKQIPMTMEDWAKKLDAFLQFNDEAVLQDKGRISAEVAKAFAESEFEKYRVIQDRLYQSDFDQLFQLESRN